MIIPLCSKADFTENSMLEIVHDGHSYLVAKVEDEFYVVDNIKSGQKIKLCGSMSWLDSSYFKVA